MTDSTSTPPASVTPSAVPLRLTYRQKKAELLAPLRVGAASIRTVSGYLKALARLADATLQELWKHAGFPAGLTLVAVGGYGRSELFPCSDVDVLLLLPDHARPDQDAALRQRIEAFIGGCWDAGLEIGSSVRTVDECLAESARDVTVQTSLLEARRVAGSTALFSKFTHRFKSAIDPQAFFVAKTLELRQRHTKFEDTPYALEPNCKESPGGLRDLQVVQWVARAAGFGNDWNALEKNGLATPFEVRQIRRNEALLNLIRARLHLIAGRREDRLVFDLQTAVAESFGYVTPTLGTGVSSLPPEGAVPALGRPGGGVVTPTLGTGVSSLPPEGAVPALGRPSGGVMTPALGAGAALQHIGRPSAIRPSEKLMRRYYWAAKAVTQLNQILMLNVDERLNPSGQALRRIDDRFFDKAGMVEVASDDLYQREPHAILQTFLVYQTNVGMKGLSARTLRALYNARGLMDSAFRADPVNRATFMQILREPTGITHAMRLMNQTSVLGRYLWVFRKIVGQMQHDLFHVYTVDQHILMVLRNARRFFLAEHAHEYPFCSRLAAGWDKPWLLYVAALFHDIAKGRGGDHSELGARDVRVFCRQHGIAAADAQLIEFLVVEHLSMSRIAQKSDLSDPAVIEAFARRVGSERRLTALYLLTVADIRGTGPKVWNAWKGKLLEDLYRYTVRVLGGGTPDPKAEIEARKREALVMLALNALPFDAQKTLWASLDVGYFMRHDAADIAWHARHLTRHIGTRRPVVRARLSPLGEGLQVVVYTPDQTDLFARICGYFDQACFSILDAKVHTSTDGYALDTFQIVTPVLPEHYRELTNMVELDLARTIEQAGPLPPPGRGRVSRRVRSFPVSPRVMLRPDDRAQRWLLSISASDRLGLLYTVARILAAHDVSVHLAKVSTLGERVEDTFLIEGPGLQQNRRQIALETELLEALQAT